MSDFNLAATGAGGAGSTGVAYATPPGPTALASNPGYPVQAGLNAPLEVARWRVIGNYILAIPHLFFLGVLNFVSNIFVFCAWFAVMFTGRMPEGLGTFIAGVHRYQWRVQTYILFLREQYPDFGVPSGYADPGGDPAWLQITPPTSYSRAAVFFRGLLAIPLFLYAVVLFIAFYAMWVVGFFGVLFTGRWPEGARSFAVRVGFYLVRMNAWYSLLADQYPPLSLD